MANRHQNTSVVRKVSAAGGGGALLGLILLGLFVTMVAGSCAESGVEAALKSNQWFEKVVIIPLAAVAALVGAALASAVFGLVARAIANGYRMLLTGRSEVGPQSGSLTMAGVGFGTVLLSAAVGGWRLHAGYTRGEPHWLMQGTIIAAVGVLVGVLLLAPYLVLAVRGARISPARRDSRSNDKRDSSEDGFAAEALFTFFAVLGLVASFMVVEYVHLSRAQAGVGPLPKGEFVSGWVRDDGFENYPAKTTLNLPAGLEGKHAIFFIEVSPCLMKLSDDRDQRVQVKRVASKQDSDGTTVEYARLVFDAKADRVYRLQLVATDKEPCTCAPGNAFCTTTCDAKRAKAEAGADCLYSLRLVAEHTE